MSTQQTEDFLTVKEAAAASRTSASAVYDACRARRLAYYRLSGGGGAGRILIRPADLRAFIESCRVEAGSSRSASDFTRHRV